MWVHSHGHHSGLGHVTATRLTDGKNKYHSKDSCHTVLVCCSCIFSDKRLAVALPQIDPDGATFVPSSPRLLGASWLADGKPELWPGVSHTHADMMIPTAHNHILPPSDCTLPFNLFPGRTSFSRLCFSKGCSRECLCTSAPSKVGNLLISFLRLSIPQTQLCE